MSTAPADDLPCFRVVELITDYLEDALPDGERALLEEHLAECDGCAVVLDQFRTTIDATGMIGTDDVDAVDEPTRSALLDVFRTWAAER